MDMNIAATLTRAEVAFCGDAERACGDVCQSLEKEKGSEAAGAGLGDLFAESLRLKNTLDAFEEKARTCPSWEILSVLVNCEYRLYLLNQHTPLRNNPFLSHWVESIQRLEQQLSTDSVITHDVATTDVGITGRDIWIVRLGLIKAVLQSRNVSYFADKNPKQLYLEYVQLQRRQSFDLRPYIRMLEEEDIYERTPEPPEPQSQDTPGVSTTQPENDSISTANRPSKLSNFQQWKQDILFRLKTEPGVAIPELTHLPIELSSLDFLTTLLQENTLQSCSIDPAPIISDYIQHALRLTEQMGEPSPAALTLSEPEQIHTHDDQFVDHGREAQTRAVKLLLLFIRNLIRKALVGIEAIYFEIQEICVRYVWIKEVREFRAFIEEGDGLGHEGVS
ncbi:unnamed protein product [Periconia digitata]|uniref:CCR4-NOT transcription complex subunit 11 n=1 Tax=Periconia digitata TaxID=1303443 RepID=A0A9W4XIG2_9PLEO|nr:unnamed protein product [Periconia digitata]